MFFKCWGTIRIYKIYFVYLYNKRGRRLKRKSFIIQIKGVGAVPTFRSKVVIKGVDKAATSIAKGLA